MNGLKKKKWIDDSWIQRSRDNAVEKVGKYIYRGSLRETSELISRTCQQMWWKIGGKDDWRSWKKDTLILQKICTVSLLVWPHCLTQKFGRHYISCSTVLNFLPFSIQTMFTFEVLKSTLKTHIVKKCILYSNVLFRSILHLYPCTGVIIVGCRFVCSLLCALNPHPDNKIRSPN